MYVKTEAIVLRRTQYNDSDVILTLFSRKLGKASVYARGARKPKTVMSTVAHPFIYGEFVLRGKPTFYSISSAEIIDSNYFIREDLHKLSMASYFMELCQVAVQENLSNNRLFQLTVEVLRRLDKGQGDPEVLKLAYEIKLLAFSGYKPEVSKCVKCGINEIEALTGFSLSEGGLVCRACGDGRSTVDFPVNKSFIHLIRYLMYKKLDVIAKTRINKGMIRHLDKLFEAYIRYHFEVKAFRSLEFLKTIQ